MEAVDVPFLRMGILYLFITVPTIIMWKTKTKLIVRMFVSIFRMSLQLTLVGLYLKYIFELNNIFLNIFWVLIMMVISSLNVVRNASLRYRYMFLPIFTGIVIGTFFIIIPFLYVIKSAPIYNARYLIPITGMILGNILTANTVGLTNYSVFIKNGKKSIQSALCFGATKYEALLPFISKSFRLAITPTLTSMGTMGLVSLPGMMTGQLLSGVFPIIAIKYQILIMLAIFVASSVSLIVGLNLVGLVIFDKRDNLILEVYK